MKVKSITENNFKDEIENTVTPVVVDFFASWCGPCQRLSECIEELAREYYGSVTFFKVNVETEKTLSEQFEIISVPTLITFKNGEAANRKSGFESKEDLVDFIQTAMG